MRLAWRLGLAVIALVLLAPGSASAAGDCSAPPPVGVDPVWRCDIVSTVSASPNPVSAGQVATFTVSVSNTTGDTSGEDAPDVEVTLQQEFPPADDPGDFQTATVTTQPSSAWSCASQPEEAVRCHGPLDNGESVVFKASYLITGPARSVFFDVVTTDGPSSNLKGEEFDDCDSLGGTQHCDFNNEDDFAELDIGGTPSSGGGSSGNPAQGGQALLDRVPPAFLGASMKPRTFAVGKAPTAEFAKAATGTKVVYTLSEAGMVRMALERKLEGRRVKGKCVRKTRGNRKRRRCARYIQKGALVRRAEAGTSVIPWTGRVGKRVMKPGRYRMSLTAVDAANNRSAPRRMFFRIKKPKRKR